MNPLTDITLVLDCSLSMKPIRRATVRSVNALISNQKAEPAGKLFSLLTFSSVLKWQRLFVPIRDVAELRNDEYQLSQGTRLFDAIGESIVAAEQRGRHLKESGEQQKVLIAIETDGLENSSVRYTHAQIYELISKKRQGENWEFMILAANQDAFETAASLGIPVTHALNFECTPDSSASATSLLSAEISKFSSGMRTGFFPAQPNSPPGQTDFTHGT